MLAPGVRSARPSSHKLTSITIIPAVHTSFASIQSLGEVVIWANWTGQTYREEGKFSIAAEEQVSLIGGRTRSGPNVSPSVFLASGCLVPVHLEESQSQSTSWGTIRRAS